MFVGDQDQEMGTFKRIAVGTKKLMITMMRTMMKLTKPMKMMYDDDDHEDKDDKSKLDDRCCCRRRYFCRCCCCCC